MKRRKIADMPLYRWRYTVGYSLLTLFFAITTIVLSLYAPGGLTEKEMQTLGVTNTLDFSNPASLAVPNLPFHALQAFLLNVVGGLLGVSIFTIKLPAILLSIATAITIFFLLRRWFKPNIAILTLFIMAATGQFIYIAQNATPDIMYILLSSLILLFASLVIQKASRPTLWRILLVATAAISLYTPYFWYINAVLLLGAFAHPHVRHFLLRRKYRYQWLPALFIGMLLLAPLAALCIINPPLLADLLGLNAASWDVLGNLKQLLFSIFWIKPVIIDGQIMPLFSYGTLILILLGFLRTVQQRSTARTYMIWAWLILMIPLLILVPQLISIIIVPVFIILAVGVETLLGQWYSIFPNNPYARAAGLLLIIGVISIIAVDGINRYTKIYRFMPEVAAVFNNDSRLLAGALARDSAITLIVDPSEKPLYDAIARHDNRLVSVETELPKNAPRIYVSHLAKQNFAIPQSETIEHIITNGKSVDADRFYVYNFTKK